ncbi:DUF1616 domain-containing protein [Chloroflexota bacterium]
MKLFKRILAIILILSILTGLSIIPYITDHSRIDDDISEFYILGFEGKANDYPVNFFLENGQVKVVEYNDSSTQETNKGVVVLGIINRSHETANYSIRVLINGEQLEIYYNGEMVKEVGSIILANEEKWENEIGIIPDNIGNNQRVDFILYKKSNPCFNTPPYLWINVRD